MAEPKFKVGDVVSIKSHSEPMTIEYIFYVQTSNGKSFDDKYRCVWHLNGTYQKAEFVEDTLMIYKSPSYAI
ncbi:MAG: hypothetical protein JWR72_2073 [Flavisolibacter sp.]|nr:hypothetical protein [Flavisolibacter sp.]